jgi:hypothetical protein
MNLSSQMTRTLTGTLCLGVALSTVAACGSSGPGEGENTFFLTLVGDRNVYVENGERYELQVRYHDRYDEPLAGIVNFTIDGQTRGARLLSTSGSTDSNGVATVTLDARADDQAQFFVEATAPGAGTATWSVTIEQPAAPLDPRGVYQINSTFDLVEGLEEGTVRDVVHGILDFTDDPGTFLLMLAVEHLGWITEDQAKTFGPALTTLIKQNAPDFVNNLLEFGDNFGHIVQNFGVVSELTIRGEFTGRTADHKLTGVEFAYGTDQFYFTMGDMDVNNVEAKSVTFSLADNERDVSFGEHSMPFSYGAMLRIALEQVLIPAISNQNSLRGLLETYIPCDAVGEWLDERGWNIGQLGEAACAVLITMAATEVMNLIDGLDDVGLHLNIGGTARPVDTNRDGKPDVFLDGRWNGELTYAGRVSTTIDGARFRAERIGN